MKFDLIAKILERINALQKVETDRPWPNQCLNRLKLGDSYHLSILNDREYRTISLYHGNTKLESFRDADFDAISEAIKNKKETTTKQLIENF